MYATPARLVLSVRSLRPRNRAAAATSRPRSLRASCNFEANPQEIASGQRFFWRPAKRKTLRFLQRNGCKPACGHRFCGAATGWYRFLFWKGPLLTMGTARAFVHPFFLFFALSSPPFPREISCPKTPLSGTSNPLLSSRGKGNLHGFWGRSGRGCPTGKKENPFFSGAREKSRRELEGVS